MSLERVQRRSQATQLIHWVVMSGHRLRPNQRRSCIEDRTLASRKCVHLSLYRLRALNWNHMSISLLHRRVKASDNVTLTDAALPTPKTTETWDSVKSSALCVAKCSPLRSPYQQAVTWWSPLDLSLHQVLSNCTQATRLVICAEKSANHTIIPLSVGWAHLLALKWCSTETSGD